MKKMFITALVLMASATTTTMVAQEWSFGAKAGINITNVSGSDMNAKAGYSVGGIAKYNFNDNFALKGEMLFSGQGAKEEYTEYGITVDAKFLLNYMNIPIIASYNIIEGLSAGVGVQPGFLLAAKVKASVEGVSAKENISGQCNNVDFSIPLEVCYDFNNGIHVGLRYSLGVTDVLRYDYEASRNQVFNMSVGYMF